MKHDAPGRYLAHAIWERLKQLSSLQSRQNRQPRETASFGHVSEDGVEGVYVNGTSTGKLS